MGRTVHAHTERVSHSARVPRALTAGRPPMHLPRRPPMPSQEGSCSRGQAGRVLRGAGTGNDKGGFSSACNAGAALPLTTNSPFILKLCANCEQPTAAGGRAARRFNASVHLAYGKLNSVRYVAIF